MKKLYLALLSAVVVLFLPACNDDVFIKPLVVSTEKVEVGPENKSGRIDVSGKDWLVKDVWFDGDEGYSYVSPSGDGSYHVETVYTDLYVRQYSDCIGIELVNYCGNSPATLGFVVTDRGSLGTGIVYIPRSRGYAGAISLRATAGCRSFCPQGAVQRYCRSGAVLHKIYAPA